MGAEQVRAHDPAGAGGLIPSVRDKDAGLGAIAPGFDIRAYKMIAVDGFPVAPSEIHDEEDRALAATIPPFRESELVRRLRKAGLFPTVIDLSEASLVSGAEKSLRLEGVITRLARGSQAVRYFVGFGVGRSKVQAELRFVDAQTEQVLMVTADRRVGARGFGGGGSEELVRESFADMAKDLVDFLSRLAKGQVLKPGQ
jgi:Domain of unknown function (DUF4410)